MAHSSSSQTSESPQVSPTDYCSIPSSLEFVISNIKTIVTTQLSPQNYAAWKSQVLKLLNANGFSTFLDPSAVPPSRTTRSPDGSEAPNPKYDEWNLIDHYLAAALCLTISPAILPYVTNLKTCSEIWATIERRLQATNRLRVIHLKNVLHNIQMKNSTMSQYLTEIKTLVDHIAAAGSNVDTEDIILHTLNGLPQAYQAFKTSIRINLNPISLEDFYSLLMSEEIYIKAESLKQVAISDPHTALLNTRGRGRRGRGRSTASSANPNPSNTVTCQICNKRGHSASTCWHRSNLSYRPTEPAQAKNSQNNALIVADNSFNPDWYLDSGASAHLTHSLDNMANASTYGGTDNIAVGDGRIHQIAHRNRYSDYANTI